MAGMLGDEGDAMVRIKALQVPVTVDAAIPGLKVRPYTDAFSDSNGYVMRGNQDTMHINSLAKDPQQTIYHEAEHLLANRGLGHGLGTNEVYDEMQRKYPALPKRGILVLDFIAAADVLEKKYGLDSGYFTPEMATFQRGRFPNLLAEQIATLSALEQKYGIDILSDPDLRLNKETRAVLRSVMGLRQTRLDSKDLKPYTPIMESRKERK